MQSVSQRTGVGTWATSLAALPGVLLSLLPSFTCPACVAAYAGVLSSLGLGFMLTERVLAPLIVVFLTLGIASVAWSTRSHRRPGPLVATTAGSIFVVLGRLTWTSPPLLYIGMTLVIGATLWNLWLKRRRPVPLVQIGRGSTNDTTGQP